VFRVTEGIFLAGPCMSYALAPPGTGTHLRLHTDAGVFRVPEGIFPAGPCMRYALAPPGAGTHLRLHTDA
ncbi:hypothetical protein NDU88_000341, partial [Pleurodeles waltl]